MITLNDLIVREIAWQINRQPTPAEILDAAQWMHEHINEKKAIFVDYEYEIMMWKNQLKKDE